MTETETLEKRSTLASPSVSAANRLRKIAISSTVWVILFLLSVQLVWNLPKQLFAAVTGLFLMCSLLYWFGKRNDPYVGSRHVVQVIALWILTAGTVFGAVYQVDRAGWNWFLLTGYNVTLSQNYFDRIQETAAECAVRYGFISEDPADSRMLFIRKGVHEVNETVVIPRNVTLEIEPGAELRFGSGCSLIAYGAVLARGTEEYPIVFTAQTKFLKWGAVGLAGMDPSVFEHVRFEHGRQARVNDLDFVAGLTVIGSEVKVTNCSFTDMFGKDAMNVRNGQVAIHHNVFKNTFKDGLDLDGGSGEVSFNEFVNCGDEGIDLSENKQVRVFSNKILDRRGGRISADEDLERIRSLNALGYLGE